MTTTTATKRQRTTAYATSAATGKRITKSKTYTVAEVADLTGVSTYAVQRWVSLGYVKATKAMVEGTKRTVTHITGEALADFFAARKQHTKEVAVRRTEREAKAAARTTAKAAAGANQPAV